MDNLVGKYYFNVKSTAAWKIIRQTDDEIECELVRIAAKWSTRSKDFKLGTTHVYKISELEKSRTSDSWTYVDNLHVAVTLYANGQEEMLCAEN